MKKSFLYFLSIVLVINTLFPVKREAEDICPEEAIIIAKKRLLPSTFVYQIETDNGEKLYYFDGQQIMAFRKNGPEDFILRLADGSRVEAFKSRVTGQYVVRRTGKPEDTYSSEVFEQIKKIFDTLS